MKPEYEAIIDRIEGVLQNYIGHKIAPSLEFNGFEVTIMDKPYPDYSTPIRFDLIIDPVNDEGDDSDQAFEEANGFEVLENWLEGLGLNDGKVMFI